MSIYGIPEDEMGIQAKEAEDTSMYGIAAGETCNRYGCRGTILEGEKEGDGCSCHINPPCSYCTENVEYCPECGWDAKEEQDEYDKKNKPTQAQIDRWKEENEKYKKEQHERKELVDMAYAGNLQVDRIISYVTKSWHSGYAVKGCAPIGTSWEAVKIHFNANYPEAMPKGNINPKTGGFMLSQFTD